MAYKTIKQCLDCGINVVCNSNKQVYCVACARQRREAKRPEWEHNYYEKNAETKNAKSRAYNKSEKGEASQMVRDAIRQGKMTRGSCEVCNEPNAQGHHEDYSKPLEVRWLCAKHHREEHLFTPWQNKLRRAGYTGSFPLGKLIGACGPIQFRLQTIAGSWVADNKLTNAEGYGSTPEEAVSELWLALESEKYHHDSAMNEKHVIDMGGEPVT